MKSMPFGNVKQDCPADCIESLFPVIVLSFGLLRFWERDTQFLERLFLLGAQLSIPIFTVKYMALMDVRSPFIQMERPV